MIVSLVTMIALTRTDLSAEIKASLDAEAVKHFAGVVYAVKDGKEIFYHSVGFADREAKRPFTRDTGIEIGSIVKPVVKVAILRLEEEGKISLSDSIARFFPEAPEDKKPITIKMLLSHTSGFKDVFGGDYEPMTRDDLMVKMLASKLLFEPGSKEEYSNSGYSMLSTIIEMVTKEDVESHIARTQFKPLGLARFGYVLPAWKPEETTVGYRRDGARWGTPRDKFWYPDGPSWNLRGNGGMIATVGNLAAWCHAAHNGRFLKPESYKVFAPMWAEQPPTERSLWGAAGGNGIFNTVLVYNPHRKLVMIAASTDARFQVEDHLRPYLSKLIALADQSN